jgi:thymidylate synthase
LELKNPPLPRVGIAKRSDVKYLVSFLFLIGMNRKNRTDIKNLNNVDFEYHNLLEDILVNGHQKGDRTGTGTKSVFGRQVRFNMKDGFPLLTTKKLHLRSIIHELLWFLQGDTNIKYLNDNKVTIWDEWADENGDLGPVYGKQWVKWRGIDDSEMRLTTYGINQIQNLIDRLNTVPDCRRMIVSAWNVGELSEMKLMPCHYGFQVWSRELSTEERMDWLNKKNNTDQRYRNVTMDELNAPSREISLMWNQRSVDTGLGLPFNIASYGLLLEMLAQQTNMIAGELIGSLGDTHVYSNHVEQIKEQLGRESKGSSPKLVLNKAKDIFSYKFEDFTIEGYEAHPSIKMPIAV